jgi:hypothetical protein
MSSHRTHANLVAMSVTNGQARRLWLAALAVGAFFFGYYYFFIKVWRVLLPAG